MRTTRRLVLLLLLALVTSAAAPQEREDEFKPPALRIGDPAPRLAHVTWIQGAPVPFFVRGKVYVLDFFGASPAMLEHVARLDALHESIDDSVQVIGVASGESVNIEHMSERVAWLADDLSYTVCADETARLREAFGFATESDRSGYPGTMVIDQRGRLAYIGLADSALEACVAALLADSWDLEDARASYEAALTIWREVSAEAHAAFLQVLNAHWEDDLQAHLEGCLEMARLHPHYEPMRGAAVETLFELGQPERALREMERFVLGPCKDAPFALASFARTVVDAETLGPTDARARDLALRAVERAVELAPLEKLRPLTTLAAVHAARGEWAQAVAFQQEALAGIPRGGITYHANLLADYQAKLAEATNK